MTIHVVADGITAKRKPTVDEMEILLVNRLPDGTPIQSRRTGSGRSERNIADGIGRNYRHRTENGDQSPGPPKPKVRTSSNFSRSSKSRSPKVITMQTSLTEFKATINRKWKPKKKEKTFTTTIRISPTQTTLGQRRNSFPAKVSGQGVRNPVRQVC